MLSSVPWFIGSCLVSLLRPEAFVTVRWLLGEKSGQDIYLTPVLHATSWSQKQVQKKRQLFTTYALPNKENLGEHDEYIYRGLSMQKIRESFHQKCIPAN